jgi:hypothetical protein
MTDAIDPKIKQIVEPKGQSSDNASDQDPESISDNKRTSEDELFFKQELDADLDLEVTKADEARQSLTAAENKEKQINAWTSKIAQGKAKVEDLPNSLSWLRPEIEKRILLQQREPNIEDIIERKLAEKDAQLRFADLKDKINELDLTKSQQASISQEFKSLLADGVPKIKALNIALKVVGISIDKEEARTSELFKTMAVRGGHALQEDEPLGSDLDEQKLDKMKKQLPLNKRIEFYETLRKSKR